MKKKLDTRFPAARIKKIMQSDDDVGKIAMAVPLLVSKALELFLQDLCDRTYEITLKRGAKTMSSSHLKQCVHSFNVFDFLQEIVRRVPDLSASTTTGADGQPVVKRRKLADHEDDDGGDCSKSKMAAAGVHSSGRGQGRGRGRGRGRGSRASEVDKFEDNPDMFDKPDDEEAPPESQELKLSSVQRSKDTETAVRNFDLNMELDEDGNAPSITSSSRPPETTGNICDVGPLGDFGKIGIDSVAVRLMSPDQRRVEEDDYDKEE